MDISIIIDILILAALLYVAYKLHAVSVSLSRFLEKASRDREIRESSPSAQTINVNVAPGSGPVSSSMPLAVSPAAGQDAAAAAGSYSSEAAGAKGSGVNGASSAHSVEASAPERKSAQSGPFSVQCSRCHAENSSYRTECFNCGNPL